MKITKTQLRRIIKEKLMHEAPMAKTDDAFLARRDARMVGGPIGSAITALVEVWADEQLQLIIKDPEAFDERSTKAQWAKQVEAATTALKEEIAQALEGAVTSLDDGQYADDRWDL